MVARRRGRNRAAVRAVVAVLGTALVGSAAGCAKYGAVADDSPVRPGQHVRHDALATVRHAADGLVKAGSSRTRTAVRTAAGGTRVTVAGHGVFDYVRRRGRLEVTLPREAPGSPAGEPITEVIVPGALYLKNRGAGVPADKWVRLDTGALPDGNLVTSGATDPLRAAELLRGVREVSYEGTRRWAETVVRHYRGTTDLAKAAKAAGKGSRKELAAAAKGFSEDAVAFDAFIDGQGRLRKVRHRFSLVDGMTERAGGAGEGAVAVTSTTTMYGFGTPAEVVLPQREDIYTGTIAVPEQPQGGLQ